MWSELQWYGMAVALLLILLGPRCMGLYTSPSLVNMSVLVYGCSAARQVHLPAAFLRGTRVSKATHAAALQSCVTLPKFQTVHQPIAIEIPPNQGRFGKKRRLTEICRAAATSVQP